MTTPPPSAPDRPERWRSDAGDADVATLTIPPDAHRARRFEIDCRFVVAAAGDGATHGVRVEVDGALEWTRDGATHNHGHTDSTDYHFRREVPVGRPLRVVVKTRVRQARRVSLAIEAEEQR